MEKLINELKFKFVVLFSGATDPEREKCSCLIEAQKHCQSDSPHYDIICQKRQMLVVSVKHANLFITM